MMPQIGQARQCQLGVMMRILLFPFGKGYVCRVDFMPGEHRRDIGGFKMPGKTEKSAANILG
jgi:hypothetical protein